MVEEFYDPGKNSSKVPLTKIYHTDLDESKILNVEEIGIY